VARRYITQVVFIIINLLHFCNYINVGILKTVYSLLHNIFFSVISHSILFGSYDVEGQPYSFSSTSITRNISHDFMAMFAIYFIL